MNKTDNPSLTPRDALDRSTEMYQKFKDIKDDTSADEESMYWQERLIESQNSEPLTKLTDLIDGLDTEQARQEKLESVLSEEFRGNNFNFATLILHEVQDAYEWSVLEDSYSMEKFLEDFGVKRIAAAEAIGAPGLKEIQAVKLEVLKRQVASMSELTAKDAAQRILDPAFTPSSESSLELAKKASSLIAENYDKIVFHRDAYQTYLAEKADDNKTLFNSRSNQANSYIEDTVKPFVEKNHDILLGAAVLDASLDDISTNAADVPPLPKK